jgi:hypothetical protein
MATTLGALETAARLHLQEITAAFWTSAELIDILNKGIQNLWGAVVDLHEEHYMTVDVTNVSQAVDGTTLTGVPSDVFRILLIEPRDTTSASATRHVQYFPRDYASADFRNARQLTSQDPSAGLTILYAMSQAGPPVGTPTVLVAPKLSSALTLRFVYVPSQAVLASSGNNPIPGESDNALVAWCVAYAKAKESPNGTPDLTWLSVFKTEKDALLVRLAPRQTQEPTIVEDLFGAYW